MASSEINHVEIRGYNGKRFNTKRTRAAVSGTALLASNMGQAKQSVTKTRCVRKYLFEFERAHAWLWTALTLPGLASVIPLDSKCLCCTSVTCPSKWSPGRRLSEAFLEMEFRRQYPKFLDIPLPFLNDDLWLHVLEVSRKK
ncbi:MAG: hypothetical protein CMK59_02835 [Proteobacteria bacterium]|nr:hypothetical protein [Pseudomonadota bacterium]